MKYMGSKARIAKHILPIMLKEVREKGLNTWVEPFVGGGNIIDKVPNHMITRIGVDKSIETIAALNAIKQSAHELPEEVSEEYYKYVIEKSKKHGCTDIDCWVRFACSFGGRLDNGYARSKDSKGNHRNHCLEAKRNAIKQSSGLRGVYLFSTDYRDLAIPESSLVYCDPPYKNTTKYKESFNHDEFWEWVRMISKTTSVFVSEYDAPSDFEIVWEGNIKTTFASQRTKATHNATEKLFKLKNN